MWIDHEERGEVPRGDELRGQRPNQRFLAELVGPWKITPEVQEPSDEIYTIGAAWHPVAADAPLACMEPEHWAELAEPIKDELARHGRSREV